MSSLTSYIILRADMGPICMKKKKKKNRKKNPADLQPLVDQCMWKENWPGGRVRESNRDQGLFAFEFRFSSYITYGPWYPTVGIFKFFSVYCLGLTIFTTFFTYRVWPMPIEFSGVAVLKLFHAFSLDQISKCIARSLLRQGGSFKPLFRSVLHQCYGSGITCE